MHGLLITSIDKLIKLLNLVCANFVKCKITKLSVSLNFVTLRYMNDLKLFAKNEKDLISIAQLFSSDIGMTTNLSKSTYLFNCLSG